ncbi:MAG: cyclopropane fatty acyl phospholipid synthase [Candidatus Marinimicrobia bacterium]|nr:cyclopropane fatty acyl phospholipid synthase [Candidatus Neomarinimicrobiota bacterium]
MSKEETLLVDLFKSAGVEINGNKPYDPQVHDKKFYKQVFRKSALGLGESYMDGWWDCSALDQFFDMLLRARLDKKVKGDWKITLHALKARIYNLQKPSRAYEVGEKHYDLGNNLFTAMLDKRMNYSCAYWKNTTNLDDAQEAKLELVCKKIDLQPGMKVLDLGCGFGAFAGYAAEKYEAEVTGVTVSKRQVELASERYKDLPVKFLLEDYRNVDGKYDRVISLGFMEHIGYKNHRSYMEVVNRTLNEKGISFIQTIGNNISNQTTNAWTSKYIFPNSLIPSIAQIGKTMEGIFVMEDWHNFGPDYDKTLMAWYDNFEKAWPELKTRYDERFYRMWRYYLLCCAGSFRARDNQLWQIVMSREGSQQPVCRFS